MRAGAGLARVVLLSAALSGTPASANPDYTQVGSCAIWQSLTSITATIAVSDTASVTDVTYAFRHLDPETAYDMDIYFIRDIAVGQPKLLTSSVRYGAGPERPVRVQTNREAWRIVLMPEPSESQSCIVHLRYSQAVSGHQTGLALRPCGDFRQKLDYCTIEVTMPTDSPRPRFSLPMRRVGEPKLSQIYEGVFQSWAPKGDLLVQW